MNFCLIYTYEIRKSRLFLMVEPNKPKCYLEKLTAAFFGFIAKFERFSTREASSNEDSGRKVI